MNKPKNKELFVTDISFDAGEEDLRNLFSVCGTVRSIHMLTDAKSGKFTGRAFVRMADDAQTKEAISLLDGARLINRCIQVSEARPKSVVTEPVPPPVENKKRAPRTPKGRRR